MELLSPLAVISFFFLGFVFFGWFLLTRFQVFLQGKKEDQSLLFGLLGNIWDMPSPAIKVPRNALEQFGRRVLAAD